MAGFRLHVISPLVLVAARKCARDPFVYVRKCAANALPKVHDLRLEENAKAIVEIIGIMLNDSSPGVVGAAAAAIASLCPNNLPLIGRNYTRVCEILPDLEEWDDGQINAARALLTKSASSTVPIRTSEFELIPDSAAAGIVLAESTLSLNKGGRLMIDLGAGTRGSGRKSNLTSPAANRAFSGKRKTNFPPPAANRVFSGQTSSCTAAAPLIPWWSSTAKTQEVSMRILRLP
ncbi:hypothetical protein L2E82_47950 [Cichorium intybus]|uniref:Uncharacterized protein n=1 Tax=Cichorium intybus TaxID=13427 RepID=A0ACB8YXE4_CICIN|nr:hypothetical protein L2E82_47950 [Cichorium intybus]